MRQAHPGPSVPPYRDDVTKTRDAQRYQQEEGIAWPVLIDDLDGSVHQVYGGLSDPSYLIDADGRAAFYNMWTHAPTLHRAITALLAQDGRGVVDGGLDRRFHLGPTFTDGWRGLQRGRPQSTDDLRTAAPGSSSLIRLGYQLRPLLAPLTLRSRPLPGPVRAALAAGLTAGLAAGLAALWRTALRSSS